MVFWKKIIFPKKKDFFLPFFYATFQCGRYGVFKKIKKKIFDPEKVKKRASKVAHNLPRPFYSTVQPRPKPKTQNWFSILWNLGTRHLFSYLWYIVHRFQTGLKFIVRHSIIKMYFQFRPWTFFKSGTFLTRSNEQFRNSRIVYF